MKRLVYSPRVDVYVKRDDGEVVDLSPYVTDCTVKRTVNSVSSATISFRNPAMRFTNHDWPDGIGPMFHPMDPITITLTRLRDRPIQVLSGYCDTTPYLQLFPGTCTITASCTLKRLQYTYWDPGLPFVTEFLQANGWQVNAAQGGIAASLTDDSKKRFVTNEKKITDGSIGGLLYAVLNEIGQWPDNAIYIESIPQSLVPIVEGIYKDIKEASAKSQDDFYAFLNKIIGTHVLGSGGPAGGGGAAGAGSADLSKAPEALQNFPRKVHYTPGELVKLCKAAEFPDPHYAAGVTLCESAGGDAHADSYLGGTNRTSYSSSNACCHGLWQLYLGNSPVDNHVFSNTKKGWENARDPLVSTWYVSQYIRKGGSWSPWECVTRGMVHRVG